MFGGCDSDFERIHILSEVSLLRSYLHFKSVIGATKFFVLVVVFLELSPLGFVGIVDMGKDVPHNTRDQESKESTSPKKETFIAHGSLLAIASMSCHIRLLSFQRLRRLDHKTRHNQGAPTGRMGIASIMLILRAAFPTGIESHYRVPRSRISNSNVSCPACFAMNSPYPRLLDTMMGNMSVPPNSSAIITQPFVSVSLLPA